MVKQKKYRFCDMFTMAFKTSPFFSGLFMLKTFVDALLPALSIFIMAKFINSAISIVNGEDTIASIYIPVAALASIMFYDVMIDVIMNTMECKRAIYFREKLSPKLINMYAKLEYRHIEDNETVDLVNRVCSIFEDQVWSMYMRILEIIDLIVYVVGIIAVLFVQIWWVAMFMFVASIPVIYIATKAGRQSYGVDREMSQIDRQVEYLSNIINSREAAEERNLYGYTEKLNKQYEEKFDLARKFRLKILRDNIIKEKSGGVVTTIYSVAAMLAILPLAINGSMDLGMFIAIMGAVFSLSERLSWGINELIEDIARKKEYLKDLTEFINLESCEDAITAKNRSMEFSTIEFRNVSFKYPGTSKQILDNISFVIEKGNRYAFVGTNGAGKTTITKLLTGLYANYEGEILIDGCSLREFSQSEIKGLSSVIYQDFARYYVSIYDNLSIANLKNDNCTEERKEIHEAIRLVGLSEAVSKLRDGLDTPLGKIMEDGIDLSGGEWQRIAMARSVLNNAPLKIFDEPTAALDPVSESMVYHNFEQISKGMTTLFISHRLGATKLADVIYVLSNGKIIESGSHAVLMEKGGIYCDMFSSQADWYNSKKE